MFVTYENNCIIYEMAKLSRKNGKILRFRRKKSLVGLAVHFQENVPPIEKIKDQIVWYITFWDLEIRLFW